MNDTRQTIDKILTEIESNNGKSVSDGKKTINQVMEILLDRKAESCVQTANPVSENKYGFDLEELKKWRDRNNQIYMVSTDHVLYCRRPITGKIQVFVRRVLRKLIRPIIYPIVAEQNEFNASVTASINALYNNDLTTNAYITAQESYNAEIGQLKASMESCQNKLEILRNKIESLHSEVECLENKKTEDAYNVIDYSKFEAHFRGTKEEVKNSLRQYLPYFEGKTKVVDLGCGRGEFLELLKEDCVDAIGVDSYNDFVEDCKKRKLNVVQADALDYISEREDEELDGIFASQLVEHLKTSELVKLCQQAYCKLKFGGCLIFETPNPTCLSTFTNAFYVDPTHNNPIHPKMLEYILKDVGFTSVEIVYTEGSRVDYRLPLLNIAGVEDLQEINDAINLLTDVIFGSQNYAIIATK